MTHFCTICETVNFGIWSPFWGGIKWNGFLRKPDIREIEVRLFVYQGCHSPERLNHCTENLKPKRKEVLAGGEGGKKCLRG